MQGWPGLEETKCCKTSRLRKVCSQKEATARTRALSEKGMPPRPPGTRPGPAPGSGRSGQLIPAGPRRARGAWPRSSTGPELQPGGLDPDPASPRPLGPSASPRPAADLCLGHRSPPGGGVQVTRGRAAGSGTQHACAQLELPFAAAKRRSHPNRPIVGRLCGPAVQTPELREP